MLVVAEGIEIVTQRSLLTALGISLGQGYLFGKPQSPEDPRQLSGASACRQPQPALAPADPAASTRSASAASSRH
jgi:EAL domain-containing protein (putative c-di-GMP-specific phosphodiesterase class I)